MYDNHAYGLYFALNVNTTPTSTEIYFESNDAMCYTGCGKISREKIRAINSTANNSTNITRSPHLSELVGIRFPNQPKINECNKWKIWETMIYENDEESEVVTRFYEEILHFCQSFYNSGFDRETDKESFILEERIKFLYNGYQVIYTFPVQGGKLERERKYYEIFTSVQNDSMALTNIRLNITEMKYFQFPNQISTQQIHEIANPEAIRYQMTSLVVSLFDTLDRFNVKLVKDDFRHENEFCETSLNECETIFDAIIYDHGTAKALEVFIENLFPRFLKAKSLTRSNEFFKNIVTSGIINQVISAVDDGMRRQRNDPSLAFIDYNY